MYEYFIINLNTNKTTTIFGRTYEGACEKWNINPAEHELIDCEYVD